MSARARFWFLAAASVILFLGTIRLGDLAGYDDALYAAQAKNIVRTGDWLNPAIRGEPTLEHPPLFVWMQALFFSVIGISDFAAKLPVALCAIATILLIYWLANRYLHDSLAASVAMFVMLATPYFIKYSAHAMTDVPVTFLFVCAMCSWSLQERNARWCLAAGIFAALALLTRGLVGIGLLLIFAIDWSIHRRIPRRHLFLTGVITVLPLAAWYAYLLVRHPQFAAIHQGWLEREVFGPLVPPWRRYTGAIEYAYMLLKSYWPWLPAMVAGIVLTIRQRRRELYSLVIWGAVVFFLCAVTRSRVLRYLLPAYPAFAILSAGAISKFARRSVLEAFMNWATAGAVCTALAIVWFWHPNWQAGEIRPIARAASEPPGQAVAFYDAGQPRYDEANQLEWYGDCVPRLLTSADLNQALRDRAIRAFVIDRGTYEKLFRQIPHSSVVESGHLVYARVQPPGAPPPYQ